jgi:hypothetical protein
LPEKNFLLEKFLGDQPFSLEEILEPYAAMGQRLKPLMANVSVLLQQAAGRATIFSLKAPRGPTWTSTTAPIPMSPPAIP